MPLLKIVASKKVTAFVTIEDATARQVDQYAAMTKASADDVVQAALEHVFTSDKDFTRFREENASAKPAFPLRMKKAAGTPTKQDSAADKTGSSISAAR